LLGCQPVQYRCRLRYVRRPRTILRRAPCF
jgi:hypothetical protein